VGRQIVKDDTDTLGLREVNVNEVAHASREVDRSPALGDLDLAPGPMDVEEYEQVCGAIALVLAVVALDPSRRDLLGDSVVNVPAS
jgi:hypothetical protein